MSGLEVVALVAGIISAFSGTAAFLQDRKKRKAEQAEAKKTALHNLQLAVTSAPPQIQGEYDRDFGRIGSKFASGDCECTKSCTCTSSIRLLTRNLPAIARDQLTGILISMQQNVIQTLQALLVANSPSATIDYTALLGITDSSRLDSVSALAQQYQRFSTAAPITSLAAGPTKPTAKKPQWCPGGLRYLSWKYKDGTFCVSRSSWKCGQCKVDIYTGYPKGACEGMHWCFIQKQHIVSPGGRRDSVQSVGTCLVWRPRSWTGRNG
jgi:hypothetical protein